MNRNNLEYLQENLKYLGFDTKMNADLERNISAALPEFKLQLNTSFNEQPMDATLHFRRSNQEDMYFFNKYDASLKDAQGEQRTQTFYINKGSGVTLKEAYNLLNGRSVHKQLFNKEGEKYQAWLQLDFSQKDKYDNNEMKMYHANYGYDLAAAVSKHPVKEMGDDRFRDALLRSLQKGNVQGVMFTKDGTETRMFLEANPQFKTVNVYDEQMKPVRELNKKEGQEVPSDMKGEWVKPAKAQNSKLEQQPSQQPLLQKKRTSQGKGMHP